ncbi:putative disease resistance protein At5g05400 isoform X1 [Cicer arietinum]
MAKYLAGPVIREVQYFLCVNKVMNDLENEKEVLASERDNLLIRVAQAKERTEVIEKPVEKWLNDVENLLRAVEDLVQRMETDNNCFQGWFPTCRRYLLCKQMVQEISTIGKLKGKSNDIQPFSHRAQLPGIQYHSSEDFIYFESTKLAYNELMEALKDDCISIIGVYGLGGCGKTTLVTEVGKKSEELDMFDKVISITVSRTPNNRGIQGKIADMLNLKLMEESEEGRAQRIWLRLKDNKRILLILDDLWREFHLKDIGIRLDNVNRSTWKILVTTRREHVCTLMDCQKNIHLGLLSEDESWTLFRKFARIDDEYSELLDSVPRRICNECKGLPITIKTIGSSLKGRQEIEWQQAFDMLRDSKASNDEDTLMPTLNCFKFSYDYLQRPEAQRLFLMCSLFPEDYHIPIEDLMRYAIGQGVERTHSLQSTRSLIQAHINKLLDSCLLMPGSVKMHDMVRDAALWIANRSENCKILVNLDEPLSIAAENNKISDCFAVSSWWYNESPSFCQLHAPNLKMLLLNIVGHRSWNSLDLSHLIFEGIQGLEVLSLTIDYKIVPLSFPPSIQLLTNVRTLRLNGLKFGDISFIGSLTRLEVLDLRRCEFDELPTKIGKLKSLKLLDLSECHIFENNYNGAIGKCSNLEELYASACYPEEYVYEIILDIGVLPNLQRFVLNDPIVRERTRVLQLNDFDISKLRTTKKIFLQIAEIVVLRGLHGECKNIIPNMVEVVGGMNNLSTLCFVDCQEIECILDKTSDSKVDDLIPMLVELRLQIMRNLKGLCQGPTLQVLPFFEKLEILELRYCPQLHNIFPLECKLHNLKSLNLSYSRSSEVLFPLSVAQSLLQLEKLIVEGCDELKHIILCDREHDFNARTEIVQAQRDSHFLMPCLREVKIHDCWKLESIFPICYVEGLSQLQMIDVWNVPQLEYVFDECYHAYQPFQDNIFLPNLEVLKLCNLHNLFGMFPLDYSQVGWPYESLRKLTVQHCSRFSRLWLDVMVGSFPIHHLLNDTNPSKLQELVVSGIHHLSIILWNLPISSLLYLQYVQVSNCENLKCLFSMEKHSSLPELMSLRVYDCQKLEQIFEANEEHLQLPNMEVYFPKLKHIEVQNCNNLKSLFPVAMVRMLPQLSTLRISKANQLEEVFKRGPGDDIINQMEVVLPNLSDITLDDLPSFIDIFHTSKLYVVKPLKLCIYKCPKASLNLRNKFRMKLEETADEMMKLLSS